MEPDEKENFYHRVLERLAQPVYLLDGNRDFEFVNQAGAEITGYTAEELIGKPFSVLFDPAELGKIDEQLLKIAVDDNAIARFEMQVIRKNGSNAWIEFDLTGLFGGAAVSHFLCTASDISWLKKAQDIIKANEDKYRELIKTSLDTIVSVDQQMTILLWNPAATRTFGYTEEEMLGRPFTAIFAEQSRGFIEQGLVSLRQGGSSLLVGSLIELEGLKNDGTTFPIEICASSRKTGEGYVLTAIIRDITERKRIEREQAQLRDDLQHANNELKDFAYVISHDLKAPLRGISTLAEWITQDYAGKIDGDGKEQFGLLMSRVRRMHDLIDGVLQYSRVGRIREQLCELNLNRIIPEVIDPLAVPANITITIEHQLPVIVAERTRIIQVFQNLLSNAVKFMDKPRGEVKISCADDGDYWKFSITDNGPGIEEKYFDRIFKMFQTLSKCNGYESTGVGLCVVKKIVEMYGGKIYLESEVGKWTTFYFTLPKKERMSNNESIQEDYAG